MISYTWGLCKGVNTKSLVEIAFNNDYSNECQQPGSGIYYQSGNPYHSFPFECLGIPYDKLATDCPIIKANLDALVKTSCDAAITKLCTQQYESNPPFSCVQNLHSDGLTIISLAASNTMTFFTLFTIVLSMVLAQVYKKYKSPDDEFLALNPKEAPNEIVVSMVKSFCGFSDSKDDVNEKADEEVAGKASIGFDGVEMVDQQHARYVSVKDLEDFELRQQQSQARLVQTLQQPKAETNLSARSAASERRLDYLERIAEGLRAESAQRAANDRRLESIEQIAEALKTESAQRAVRDQRLENLENAIQALYEQQSNQLASQKAGVTRGEVLNLIRMSSNAYAPPPAETTQPTHRAPAPAQRSESGGGGSGIPLLDSATEGVTGLFSMLAPAPMPSATRT